MADNLRAKLKKNTTAAPAKRTADTFVPTRATAPSAARNNARTTVYLPPHIRRGLKLTAADQGVTTNELILRAIDEYAATHDEVARWFEPEPADN